MVSLICLSAVVKTCQLNVIMAGLELINNVQILKEKSFFLSEKKINICGIFCALLFIPVNRNNGQYALS